VLAGIDAAERAGFFGIKVNCVVRRGQNEDQIVPLVRLFSGRGIEVRFIEYMDVGTINGWDSQAVVRCDEILARLAELGAWEPVPAERASDVASRFVGPAGTVGIISSVSAPFCGSCSRARLSADGKLFGCLFAANGLSLKAPLRRGASDEELSYLIQEFWRHRADRYSEQRQQVARLRRQLPIASGRVEMAYIGG
jgi:cyclic pyranopterin phosphate synthase